LIVRPSGKFFVAEAPSAPVTRTVKLDVPVAVGVPSRSPEGLRFNPAGRLPEEIAQLYGVVPPDAENDMLYGVPTVPVGREAVVIERAAATGTSRMVTPMVAGLVVVPEV
jgi:hypothetical protein